MNKKLIRSIISIPSGWFVAFFGFIITMIAIAIFNVETFQPDVQLSVGWLLIILLISSIYGIIGGFVTAFIAQRNEIIHTIGLAIFSLLISLYFTCTSKSTVSSVPIWYQILGLILLVTSFILGGWLRMKQRILLFKRSESMIRTTKNLRFLIAICTSLIIFIIVVFFGTALGGIGLIKLHQILFDEDHLVIGLFPVLIVSVFLAFILSRYIFRRIKE